MRTETPPTLPSSGKITPHIRWRPPTVNKDGILMQGTDLRPELYFTLAKTVGDFRDWPMIAEEMGRRVIERDQEVINLLEKNVEKSKKIVEVLERLNAHMEFKLALMELPWWRTIFIPQHLKKFLWTPK